MEKSSTKKYKFNVGGTHCKSCALIIEEEVRRVSGINSANVNFYRNEIEIDSSLEKNSQELSEILNDTVAHHGYVISVEKLNSKTNWSEFIYAIPISLAVILVFYILQKLGLINFLNGNGSLDYNSVFFLGVVASLSGCLAVVGGLVLSISANYAKAGGTAVPQTLFHIGRIVGFFILGGVMGIFGNSFYITADVGLIVGIILSTVMLILGLNLLNIFEGVKNIQFLMPKFFGEKIMGIKKRRNYLTPILIGGATFFLPCGFTQSMQMYALSTHDFWKGGFIMFVFALGTFPVLALLSFSSFRVTDKKWSGIFYKTAGIIIIFLAFFNLLGALSSYGLIEPIFNI